MTTESHIKKKREKMGVSAAELSRRLDIPYRTLQDWEAGKRTPAPWAEKLILEKMDTMPEAVEKQ